MEGGRDWESERMVERGRKRMKAEGRREGEEVGKRNGREERTKRKG